jgi:hypothetical protein
MPDNSAGLAESITPFIEQELRAGKSRDAIAEALVAAGWDARHVRTVVDQTPAPAAVAPPTSEDAVGPSARSVQDEEVRAYAIRKMKSGAAWCLGGLAVTVISFLAAANTRGGGSYFLAWGAIIFGAIDFLRGWSMYRGK